MHRVGIEPGIIGLDDNPKKYDYRSGGYQSWLSRVEAVRLASIAPQRVQVWKRAFLAKAAPDPLSQRQAKVSVNSFLRRARSLFSDKIIRHLMVELPDPLPFSDASFEPRQSLKYRSRIDAQKLITCAKEELSQAEPECFKKLERGSPDISIRLEKAKIPYGKTVFLSHASADHDLVPRILLILELHGGLVYVDDRDPSLPGSDCIEIAQHLRTVVRNCGKLVVLASPNSKESKWIPVGAWFGRRYAGTKKVP